MNQSDEAGMTFAKGMEIEHAKLPDFEKNGYREADNWVDWVLGHALQKQARAVIKGGSKTDAEIKSGPSSAATAPLPTKPYRDQSKHIPDPRIVRPP
jgi:hypothetical protein